FGSKVQDLVQIRCATKFAFIISPCIAHGVSKARSLWCEQSKVIVHGVSKPRSSWNADITNLALV
ncbi:hypothetical protein J6590_106412, partial [Homalodisca vitripennis]